MTTAAVVVATWGGRPRDIYELLTLARGLSIPWMTPLVWLVLGPLPDEAATIAGRYHVAVLDHIDDSALRTFQPDVYVEALAQYCAQRRPRVLLFSQTDDARLVIPRLAGRLDCGVVMNVVGLETDAQQQLRATAAAYGGSTRAVYELRGAPALLAIWANATVPAPPEGPAANPAVRQVPVALGTVAERIKVVEPAHGHEGPRLEDAQIIVAGGRGLQEAKHFQLVEKLAEVLGGMAGASRPIVDLGWIDASHQVGLTGKITKPVLYIAAGISGASQHMVGCAAAKTLVAINRDPDAAVFQYARYGIVADCVDVLRELIRAAQSQRQSPSESSGTRTPAIGESAAPKASQSGRSSDWSLGIAGGSAWRSG